MAEQSLMDHLCTAELNEEYYRVRAARAARLDRLTQVLSALTGLGAVAVWISSQGAPAQKAWAILLILSASLSAVSPIVRWFDDAVKFTNLASRWSAVAGKLRVLRLAEANEQQAPARLRRIVIAMEALQAEDTSASKDGLIRQLHAAVKRRHGLGSLATTT